MVRRAAISGAVVLSTVLSGTPLLAQEGELVAAATTSLGKRDVDSLQKLVAPLRAAVADRLAASTALLLAWGRTEAAVGEPDSALAAFVDLTGRTDMRGRGLLEQARLLLERGLVNGPELWYLGAEIADLAVWRDYRTDLLPLLSPTERQALDGLPAGEARVSWLRAFWEERAGRDMRRGDARLAEHYKRLRHARVKYRSVYARDRTPPTIDEELDDRGKVYLRHGPPDRVISAGDPIVTDNSIARPRTVLAAQGGRQQRSAGESDGIPMTEVWVYGTPEEKRVHLFAMVDCLRRQGGGAVNAVLGCERSQDFRAMDSVFDIFGPGLGPAIASGFDVRTTGVAPLNDIERLLLRASEADPRYGELLGADRYVLPTFAQRERDATRKDLARGLSTDSYEHRYARGMRVRAEALRAGREGTKGLVHVAYAVRAGDLSPNWMQGYLEYPIRLTMQAQDTAGTVLATFDKRRIFRADALLGDDASVMGREAIAVPPGTHRLRIVLEHNALIGTALAPVIVSVPTAEPGYLSGGDLVIGHPEFPLEWVRTPGDTVRFNPSATFSTIDALELYHELYGLTSGETYRYRLSVMRQKGGVFGGRSTALTLSGTETATGAVTPVRRYLDVNTLKPGRYEVRVLYESETAGSYEVSRSFQINP